MSLSRFRNIPSFFILFIFFAASFLMGCSGGGGGGSDDPDTVNGPAPAALKAGMQFKITGFYRFTTPGGANFEGPLGKTISILAANNVSIADRSGETSFSDVTYTRHTDKQVTLTINSYPYSTSLLAPSYGAMKVILNFQSDTSGVAQEVPVSSSLNYVSLDGTFTYTPVVVVTP